MSRSVVLPLAFLCLVAGVLTIATAVTISRRDPVEISTDVVEPVAEDPPQAAAAEWLTEYELTERSGRTFSSTELDGKVHVVSFFFSSCPTVCRLQNGKINELTGEFADEEVYFVSITVDPANDTPATLQNYAKLFDADSEKWLFLTSEDFNYLRRVGAEVYMLPVEHQVHSERLLVVDGSGEVRGRFHWNKPAEIAEMRQLLKNLVAADAAGE